MKKIVLFLILFLISGNLVMAVTPDIIVQYHVWFDTPYGPESVAYPRTSRGKSGILWGVWDARRSGSQPASYSSPDVIKPNGLKRYSTTSGDAYPMIGLYDPDNPDILRWHIRLAKAAGIKAFAISAYAWNSAGEDGQRHIEIFRKMLQIAHEENFYLTWEFYYGGASDFTSWRDIFQNSNFYKVDGKPVFWIAPNPPPNNFFGNNVGEFNQITTNIENSLGFPIVWAVTPFLAPNFWIDYTQTNKSIIFLTERNIQDPGNANINAWPSVVTQYHAHNPPIKVGTHVYPGFDESIRNIGNPRYDSRNAGDRLRMALQRSIASGADFIFFESWNDFGEATAVEPGIKEDFRLGTYQGDYYKDLKIISEFTGSNFVPPPLPPVASFDPLFRPSGTIVCNPSEILLQPGTTGTTTIKSTTVILGTMGLAQVCVGVNGGVMQEMATFNNGSNQVSASWITGGKNYLFNLYNLTPGATCTGTVLASCSVRGELIATPTGVTHLGDFNGDGVVNLIDFVEWKEKYLAVPPTATLVEFGVWKSEYLKN